MKNPWVIIGVIAVLLFGGAIWYSKVSGEKNNEGVTVTEHSKGGADAAVVLTEYSDFQCPACQAFEPVVAQVLAQYGQKIRFEYKHYPLPIHQFAIQAAQASEAAAQQGKFFEYHDRLFAEQKTWSTSQTPQVLFLQYAQDLGLNVAQFKRQMQSSVIKDAVKKAQKDAGNMGLTSTPSFFLNGQKMEINSYEDFTAQIAAAIDPAAAALMQASSTGATNSGQPGIKFGI